MHKQKSLTIKSQLKKNFFCITIKFTITVTIEKLFCSIY